MLKLLTLATMLIETHLQSEQHLVGRTMSFRFVDFIGRWSMIDVFMISILVALVRFGKFSSVQAELGAPCFAAVVVLTMFAVNAFDPRLMWDRAAEHHAKLNSPACDRNRMSEPASAAAPPPPSPPSPPPPSPPPPSPPRMRLRRRRFSFVWLIPLLAASLAIYLGYRTYLEQGPVLTLTFTSADGLSAGQTQVRYKAVALGTVQSIDLSKDNSHVIIEVRMNSVGRRFMTSHARFWVEGAHFSLDDPSSLGSFVSGAFIAVDPGAPGGKYQNEFTGLDGPPGVRSGEPGRTYVLSVSKIGSLRTGSPVLFRDAVVGEVLGYDLGDGLSHAKVSIFVKAPYDDLVRPASRFWNASGISLDVLPGEFHLEFESLQAVLSGAVAFNLPHSAAGTKPARRIQRSRYMPRKTPRNLPALRSLSRQLPTSIARFPD